MLRGKILMVCAVLALSVCSAQAVMFFEDDMEAGIGNWEMTDGANTVLSIAADNGPSAAGSQALSIENLSTDGIVGGAQSTGVSGTYIYLTPNTEITYSFDYKGDGDIYFGFYSFKTPEAGGGYDTSATADFVSSYPDYAWNSWVTLTRTVTTGPDAFKLYVAFWPASGEGTCLIDNVTLTPEPATMSLLVIGGLAMLRRRRK